MFALCHFKESQDEFILADKEDFKEIAEQMNIEIEKEISFSDFDKDYSFYALLTVNDLLLRSLNKKARTATHVLDELGISCWIKLKQENHKIIEKKSNLSRSQRELVKEQYNQYLTYQDEK